MLIVIHDFQNHYCNGNNVLYQTTKTCHFCNLANYIFFSDDTDHTKDEHCRKSFFYHTYQPVHCYRPIAYFLEHVLPCKTKSDEKSNKINCILETSVHSKSISLKDHRQLLFKQELRILSEFKTDDAFFGWKR